MKNDDHSHFLTGNSTQKTSGPAAGLNYVTALYTGKHLTGGETALPGLLVLLTHAENWIFPALYRAQTQPRMGDS